MAFRSVSTVAVAATSISVSPPAGIVDGDILVAFGVMDTAGATTFTWPAGFTEGSSSPITCTADGQRFGYATKKASGESGNYTITQGGADPLIGGIACFSGRDPTSYLHRQSGTVNNTANASPWTVTSAAFPSNTANACDIIWIATSDVTSSTTSVSWSAPSGLTSRASITDAGFMNIVIASADSLAAGETGVYAGTGTAAGKTSGWVVFAVALQDTAVAGDPPPPCDLMHQRGWMPLLMQ